MRKSSVLIIVCTCGLLLCGCSAQNASDNMNDTQAEVNQTDDIGLEASQAEGASGSEETSGTQTSGITEQDALADDGGNQGNEGEISKEEAKKIALAKVPGAEKIQIKRDIEDGKPVYEGEIHYNNVEYEFEIDAVTGKILDWEEDAD